MEKCLRKQNKYKTLKIGSKIKIMILKYKEEGENYQFN